MGLYKKKNILVGAVGRLLVPEALWTRQYLLAWLGCLLTVLVFDVLWCSQTTFRALGFVGTYVNALTLATLMSMPAVFTRKSWPLVAVMLAVDLLMVANLMYCRTYFNSIPLASYLLVGNVADFTGSIGDSFRWVYLVLPGIAVATLLMLNPEERERQPNAVFYLLTLGLLALASGITAMFSGGLRTHVAKLKGECYYATTPPVIYTLFGTLAAEAMEQSDEITPEQYQMVARWGAEHVRYRTTPVAPADSVGRPDNLVIIFCESLESWPIWAKVEGKELTPNLNEALRDTSATWYAPRVLSQVGNGRSIDGQLLMLTGMYPMRDFVYSMKFADNRYYTLPMAMKENGAKTYLLSGDKPSTWNQGLVARSFGIDNTEMNDSWDNSERIGSPRRLSDNSFFTQSVAKMQRGDVWPEGEKAYVQMVTYTGHNPFRIPDEFKTISFSADFPERLRDYMTAVHYTDQALGRFLDYLRSRPDWSRTMVAIVGDHEALASWRHSLRSDPTGSKLVSGEGYVPLLILNAPVPGRREDVMGQVDVYTTLLDQLGLDYAWRGMGFSALAPGCPRFAVDYQGRVVGDTSGAPAGLAGHIDRGRAVSDLMIKYDMMSK